MAFQVRWTEAAYLDLEEIVEFVAKDSLTYASVVATDLVEAVDSLDEFPRRGRVVPEFDDVDIRELLVGRYRVIFLVRPEVVVVLGILHGSRLLTPAWREERTRR